MAKMTFALKQVYTNRSFLSQSVVTNYSLIAYKVVRDPFVGTNLVKQTPKAQSSIVSEIFKSIKKLGLYDFHFSLERFYNPLHFHPKTREFQLEADKPC